MLAVHYGFGRYTYYISQAALISTLKCLYITAFFAFWASSLARISIAAMLLLFQTYYVWRMVLWILIIIQIAIATGCNICLFIACRPMQANWEYISDAVCWTNQQIRIFSYTHSAMGIISDL